MKTKLIVLFLLWAGVVWGQTITKDDLYDKLTKDDKSISDDIYNPINFTTITERMPKSNGYNTTYEFMLGAGMDYIKKGSQIHLEFKKDYINALGDECDLQVLAYIQRKDKTIKPLSVFGFTEVTEDTNNVGLMKNASDSSALKNTGVQYLYKIKTNKLNEKSYSGEINLAWEEIAEEDKIILHVNNKARSKTGFTMTLVYDDFGWKQNPTGGFSFVKIAEKGFTEFSPAASIGYTFRYQPRKSSFFWWHFLSPSFGPMLHVFQNGDNTTIGAGISVSTFYNMVNVGFGGTINGINHGKPYFSIGLNFIESYNTLTGLIKK